MQEYDLGFIIPLNEEFRVFKELFPVTSLEVHDAIYYHTLKLPHTRCRAVAVVLGGMGKNTASQVTEKVLNHVKLKAIVLLGLAGALDQGLKLGDVVIADEINEFQAASKALEKDGSLIFQYSGKNWNTHFALKQCAGNLEFSNEALYNAWRTQVRDFRDGLGLRPEQLPLAGDFPKIDVGPVASGDTVGASQEYAAVLKGINRKFCALEMEAAGVAQAAHGRREPIPIMVVRGISDFADERKKEFDAVGNGVWRKYAMYSASAFVLHLLGAKDFQQEITSQSPSGELQGILSEQLLLAHLEALTLRPEYARWKDTDLKQVQIYLQGDSSMSAERQSAAIEAFAALMEIPPQAIQLYHVYQSSIAFQLGVPSEAVQRLRSLLQSNSRQLYELNVEQVILEGRTGEIEKWVIKEGAFNLVTYTPGASGEHYIQTESKILPLFASPYEDDTGQQREDLLQITSEYDRLLILGEPGVGKTTALERLMWETAHARAAVVPIYVPLSFYDGNLLTEIGEALGETGVLHLDNLKDTDAFLRSNRCLVLLDGLNEVRGKQHGQIVKDIEHFVQVYRHHRYVVTSRSQDILWRTLRDKRVVPTAVVIQLITDEQVREYLHAHLGPQDGKETYDSLNERLHEMIHTPLFLWMLKEVRRAGGEVPGNRGELFYQFIEKGVFTRDEDVLPDIALPRSAKKKALACLAFALQQEHRRTCQEKEAVVIVSKVAGECDPQALIREAQTHGLLKLKREQQLEFMHHAVQEYFVALALREIVSSEVQSPTWQQLGKRMLGRGLASWIKDEWWAESLVQLAGLTEHASWLVQEVSRVNPWLAFWCMIEGREVDDQTQKAVEAETVDLLRSSDVKKRQHVVRELGRLKNPRTARYLVEALDDEAEDVVNMAVQGLGRLGEPAVRHLPPHLKSDNINACRAATRALGLIWHLPPLVDLGKDEVNLRLAALEELRWLEDKRPIETIVAVAHRDTDVAVRQRAVEVLAQLGDGRTVVGPLLTILADSEPSLRASVATALGRLKDKRAIEPLTQTLKDNDSVVRRRAISALGRIWEWPQLDRLGHDIQAARQRAATALGQLGDARAIQPLIVTLLDQDETVCASAATALGQLKSGQAVEPLISVLLTRKQEPTARMSAAAALGELGDKRAISPLLVTLKDQDQKVRWGAVKSLGQLRAEQAIEPLIALCTERDLQERVVKALVQIGGLAIPYLIAALRQGEREAGISAAKVLGQIGGPQALEVLILSLESHTDEAVRANAARALGQIGGEQAVEALVSTLRSTGHRWVRYSAALSLGQLGGTKAIETLVTSLKDPDERVRRAAIQALGHAWQIDRLRHLGNEDPNMRRGAALALGQQREEQAVEPLKATLRDSEEAVRRSATNALGRIWRLPHLVQLSDDEPPVRQEAAAALGKLGDIRAMGPLIAALQDSHAEVRRSATRALGQLESELAVQSLIEVLDDNDRKVQREATEALQTLASMAIPHLIAALRDSNYWFRRRRAAETLAEIGDPVSLIETLKHSDKHVRRSAAESLAQQGNAEAVEPLIDALVDKDDFVRRKVVEALGKISDPRAAQPLVKILQHDNNWRVRQAAAESLGSLGDKDVVKSLVGALEDDEWPVRWMAAKALGKLRDSSAIEPLIKALEGDWPALWTVAEALGQLERSQERPKAIGSLVATLQDREGDKYVKDAAVEALGQIGEPIQKPLIDTVLRKGDDESRRKAIAALGQMRDARNLQPLIEALQNKESYNVHQGAMEALVQLGEAAVEPLKAVLQNTDPLMRRRAVLTLGQIGNTRAVQLLDQVLGGEELSLVRNEAEAALKAINTPEAQAVLEKHKVSTPLPRRSVLP